MSEWTTILRESGLDAYLVGGAVRDELSGLTPSDEDFLVIGVSIDELLRAVYPYSLTEPQILTVADRRIGVRVDGVEICPARKEVSTGPGHKDFDIVCDKHTTVEDDLMRRDYTVNAIAKSVRTHKLVDPFGGVDDLRNGILRTVSKDSFRDDPLRILRGLVRVAKDGLYPDDRTYVQMQMHADSIANLSGERVQAELNKLLMGDFAVKALVLARDTGVLSVMLPELEPMIGFGQNSKYHSLTVDEHTFAALEEAPFKLRVRLALLFHDSGKPASAWLGDDGRLHYYAKPKLGKRAHEDISRELAYKALTRLRYPEAIKADVLKLVQGHMLMPTSKLKRIRKLRAFYGDDLLHDLFTVRFADMRGGGKSTDSLSALSDMEALVEASQAANDPVKVKHLAVNGNDLKAAGFSGRAIGIMLTLMLDAVMGEPANNNREWLLRFAARNKGNV